MITVDVKQTKKANRFLIKCGFSDNHWVQAMPNRRFIKRLRAWEAMPVGRNVEYLLDLEKLGRARLTPEARQLCDEAVARKITRSSEPFPAWYRFKTEPRPIQKKGLDAIWGIPNPALFCEMGTGKSKLIIDWFSAKVMEGKVRSMVIWCPVSIRDNWVEELGTHCPLPDIRIGVVETQDTRQYREAQKFVEEETTQPSILICGVESVQQGEAKGRAYDLVLSFLTNQSNMPYVSAIDESHLIQNHQTNRWGNIARLADAAQARLIATGTETDGNFLDLFGQIEYLDTDILGFGDYYSFKNRYAIKGGFENRQVIGYQNTDELMDLIRPHVFQATLEEVADIPAKVMMPPRRVKLTKEQKRVCDEIRKEGGTTLKGSDIEVVADGVLAVYTAIQQVCAGHIGYDDDEVDLYGEVSTRVRKKTRVVEPERNPKILELLSIMPEIRGKALVWCKYRMEIADVSQVLRAKFGDEAVAEYHGGLDRVQRKAESDRFKKDPACRFFVLNTQVGGTGLTINEAKYSIYMSNSFKLRERLQSEARNHRIGQDEHVVYFDIVADDKVERTIMKALRDKKDVRDYIRDALRDGQKIDEFL